MPRPLRVVHLPVYRDNSYQPLLLAALTRLGIVAIDGGGGGTFLRTALTKWKPDIVHFHWLHPYMIRASAAGTLARGLRLVLEVFILRLCGVRIVWTLHNLQNHERKHLRLERWLTRAFVRLTDRVIAHCPAAVDTGRRAFAERRRKSWVVIPHGSYVGCYPDHLTQREAHDRLKLNSDNMVFLFFGRIHPYKGVLELIEAFRKVKLPNCRLLIAGKPAGDEAHQIVKQAIGDFQDIDYRPGHIADDEVQVLMRASDVVVLPFRNILTSGSVLLAMSFGRAIIAPGLGCIPETIAAGHEFLYRCGDENGLAMALITAEKRREDLTRIGTANFELAARFDWDAIAERHKEVYSCLSSRF